MVTVKEAIDLISKGAEEINLAYSGTIVQDFNWKNSFAIEIYGDFIVDWICAYETNKFELEIAVKPIKRSDMGA